MSHPYRHPIESLRRELSSKRKQVEGACWAFSPIYTMPGLPYVVIRASVAETRREGAPAMMPCMAHLK